MYKVSQISNEKCNLFFVELLAIALLKPGDLQINKHLLLNIRVLAKQVHIMLIEPVSYRLISLYFTVWQSFKSQAWNFCADIAIATMQQGHLSHVSSRQTAK